MHTTDVSSDIIVQVAIIDAHGILRASSVGPHPTRPIDLSDREHFKAHLHDTTDLLFISKPLVGRVSGKWSVQLSRRFSNMDGTFGGVVVASLDPEHFTKFYDKVDLASSGSIALIGEDGVVRSAGGQSDGLRRGQDIRHTKLFARMESGANGVFEQPDLASGQTCMAALRKVKGQPLWVSVSVGKNEVLAGSLLNLRVDCIAAALLTLAILAAMERIIRSEARAQQKSEQLEMTLESMSQGIMLVTKDLNVPVINKKCSELLRLPVERTGTPPPYDQLTEYRKSWLPGIVVELASWLANHPPDTYDGGPFYQRMDYA